jgi:MFS family permease
VAVLVVAYAVSFIDRQVVALLVEPLRHDLRISDTEIGLLQGPAFGLFYAVAGLPLGWLADRVHRVRLIACGILMWSAMTALSGMANSFPALFLARMGVGVGEAALVPAAVSLLADLYPPRRRALPMSVFTSGVSLGIGLALLLGGVFVAFAAHGAERLPVVGPWLAGRHGWQIVFLLAGSLGLPVAVAVSFLSEPKRSHAGAAPEGDLLSYLRANLGLFLPLLGGAGVIYLFTNALPAWAPTLFVREFHWRAADVGVRLGSLVAPAAIIGSILSGATAHALGRRYGLEAPLRVMVIGAALLTPIALLGPLSPTPGLALASVAAMYFAFSLCFGVATATFVAATPPRLRGRMVALYLLIGNLIGLGFGPVVVGFLLDHLPGGGAKVGAALAITAAISVVPGVALLGLALRRYGATVRLVASSAQSAGVMSRSM